MQIFFRKIHRWLGLLMAVPIIAWMASGLYFSLYPIDQIRGEHLTREPPPVSVELLASLATPPAVVRALDRHFATTWSVESVVVIAREEAVFWRIRGQVGDADFTRLVDAEGRVIPRLSETEAAAVAIGWLAVEGRVGSVHWVTSTGPGSEFRGGRLPVWRVVFDEPESLHLYVDPWSAEILARRTTRWRIFDVLWMLHIMDFSERDDFSHPLLQITATLGLAVAFGGVILWLLTTSLRRKRKRAKA